jgi:hypothetical protein
MLIKSYRESEMEVSQKEFVDMIGRVISADCLSHIEMGNRGLPPKHLVVFAKVMKIDVETIIEAMVRDYAEGLMADVDRQLKSSLAYH